ncbi:MAG TPA: GNAT family N-acetyltransferase [Prolixibacteraceae bacterium]|nr:GNAT family N-acetyltransferase [Prolixibacteraceae bacterium]
MEIKQENQHQKGSFIAWEGDQEAGVLDYTMDSTNRLVIDHTEVYPEFEGKGLGKKLVMEAVEFAREKNLKIIPLCSYASTVFSRTDAIRDVLYTS